MRKINFLTGCVVLLLLLNAGTLLLMYRSHDATTGDAPASSGGPSAFIIQALKLDAKQQEQFALLRDAHRQLARAAHEEDKRLHDAYFGLLKTDHPDKARVDSLAALIGEQQKLIERAAFEHFEQLRALCRDDQKKLFDATIDDIARRMAPQGPGGPPHPPRGDGPPPGDRPGGPPPQDDPHR